MGRWGFPRSRGKRQLPVLCKARDAQVSKGKLGQVVYDVARENATAVIKQARDLAIQGVVWRRVATRSRHQGLTR